MSVELKNVTKRFGRVVAVDNVNLSVEKGEFIVLLGPSGCGKTTTLRIIAGLEKPDNGRVFIDGRDVTDLEPGEREVGMVFQDYALYPHMTVFDNIAFPLAIKRRKLRLTKEEIRERVYSVAKMLGIEDLLDRKPTQLSGGQQQRVALARALVKKPRVWLMDEPLSNLDAIIRVHVRAELKKLQKDLGITTIYVTHDQIEALTLADRVAVMNKGRIVQVGTPDDIYENPQHVFVATFVGSPPMNIIECKVGGEKLECPGFSIPIPSEIGKPLSKKKVYLGIRPEHITIYNKPVEGSIESKVYVIEPMGSEYLIDVKLGDSLVKVKTLKGLKFRPGDKAYLVFDMKKVSIFDKESSKILTELTEVVRKH